MPSLLFLIGILSLLAEPLYEPTHTVGQTFRKREKALAKCENKSTEPLYEAGLAFLRTLTMEIMKANKDTFNFTHHLSTADICVNLDNKDTFSAGATAETGELVLSKGVFAEARSVADLAYVISHELAHISMAHGVWQMPAAMEKKLSAQEKANWREVEADNVGLIFYLKAGFPLKSYLDIETLTMRDGSINPETVIYPKEVDGKIGEPTLFFDLPTWLKRQLSGQKDFSFRHCQFLRSERLIQNRDRGQAAHPDICWRIYNVQDYQPKLLEEKGLGQLLRSSGNLTEQFSGDLQKIQARLTQFEKRPDKTAKDRSRSSHEDDLRQ